MTPLEIEVKFHLPDPERIRQSIIIAGAHSGGRSFEKNIRFDDRSCRLFNKNALLRLRTTDTKNELTYKEEPEEKNADFKIHRELEVTVSDFDTAAKILEALGFRKEQVYEKYRETWYLGDAVLCIDTMPFGNFLEIEAKPGIITDIAQDLGLDWKKRILDNYLAMFERLKEKRGLDFTDVTFENFRENPLDFAGFAHMFEAG